MILIFFFQLLIKATLLRDVNYYGAGVLYCIREDVDIETLSQDEIIKKGMDVSGGNLLPLLGPSYDLPHLVNKYKLECLSELTDMDDILRSCFGEFSGMHVFNKAKTLFKLSKSLESNFKDRFGPGNPTVNHTKEFVSQAKFTKSQIGPEFEYILKTYLKRESDYYTYDELSRIYEANSIRVSKLAMLCAFKLCKIPSGYHYSDMACSTGEKSS